MADNSISSPQSLNNQIRNISCAGGAWSVELSPGGRKAVTPTIGRAMLASAQRQGLVEEPYRWGAVYTWHLSRQRES